MFKLSVFSYMKRVKKARKEMSIQRPYPLHFKAENSRASKSSNAIKAFFFLYRGFQLFDNYRTGCFLPLDLAHIALLGTHIIEDLEFLTKLIAYRKYLGDRDLWVKKKVRKCVVKKLQNGSKNRYLKLPLRFSCLLMSKRKLGRLLLLLSVQKFQYRTLGEE